MPRYRRRPVEIEAFKWLGDWKEAPEWLTQAKAEGKISQRGSVLYIQTSEGTRVVTLGDYIIRGVQGELYPCKPDIFAVTYEEI